MRWTGWILAAIVGGYAGLASGGQPGCAGCGAGSAGWQAYQGALGGEACYSPPGYSSGYMAHPGNCGANQRPCCNNAWDGYCEHHARVQAFWTQVGVPKTRCCPAVMPRMPMTPCSECSAPTVQRTPAVAPLPALPSTPPTPSDEAFRGIGQPWMR